MNQPHMAPWWFPANDHPLDKALVDIRDHGAARQAGRRQRPPGLAATVRGDAATYRWRADEPMVPYLAFFAAGPLRDLAGHPRRPAVAGRRVSRQLAPSVRRDSDGADGEDARHRRVAGDPARRLPVQPDRRPDHQPPARLRPGEPDPADLLRRTGAEHRRARAGAPVVRRLRRRARVARHLAQRGLRHLHGAAYAEAHGGQDAQQWLESTWEAFGAGRPVLDARHRRPRAGQHLRLAGLPARRDDAPGAAAPRRRDGVLDHPAHLGRRSRGRQRHAPRSSRRWPSRCRARTSTRSSRPGSFDADRPAHTAANGF